MTASAAERVAGVRDDPEGRYQLRVAFYRKYGFRNSAAGYGTSELAFLRWEIDRGVLNPLDHPTAPGSRWWRDVNEDFLLHGEQASDIFEGAAPEAGAGLPVQLWLRYLRTPSPQSWYRAHNGSIAAGYLVHAAAALEECEAERVFLNMVLYRVLYAQAMVEGRAPGLIDTLVRHHAAIVSRLESAVANPCGDSVDVMVHLPDFYPRRYPLTPDEIRHVLTLCRGPEEEAVVLLDRVLISPYLTELYRLASHWLETPALCSLVSDGRPCYGVGVAGPAADAPPSRHSEAADLLGPAAPKSSSPGM